MMHAPPGYPSSLEIISQQFLPRNPLKMIFNKHQSQKFFQLWRYGVNISVDVQILMLQDIDKPGYRAFLEGTETKGHFKYHYSQTPNIRLHRVYLSPQDLRSHVDGRAQHGLSQVSLALQTLAESEVPQPYGAIVQHDIGGLQIAVHDVACCQHAEGFDQLLEEANDPPLGQVAISPDLLIERASVAELIEEVEIIDGLKYLDEADDIGAFDACEHLDFVEGALLQFGVFSKATHVDYFGCYFATSTAIYSSVDLAVLALTDLFVKSVVLDYLDHPLSLNYITPYEGGNHIKWERVIYDGWCGKQPIFDHDWKIFFPFLRVFRSQWRSTHLLATHISSESQSALLVQMARFLSLSVSQLNRPDTQIPLMHSSSSAQMGGRSLQGSLTTASMVESRQGLQSLVKSRLLPSKPTPQVRAFLALVHALVLSLGSQRSILILPASSLLAQMIFLGLFFWGMHLPSLQRKPAAQRIV